jgi:hypothetical protein
VEETCKETGISERIYDEIIVTADSGFHNEKNMELIDAEGITAFIADNQFRKRDVKFDESGRYKKKVANWEPEKGKHYFTPDDFQFNPITGKIMCPAGYPMWLKSKNFQSGKYRGRSFMGHIENCRECPQRSKCIRKKSTKARQVAKLDGCDAE